LTLPVENFCHREKELDDLHEKLTNSLGSKLGVVLCGFPGVGKSETARKFCKEHQKTLYKGSVMWINAESRLTLESEFQDIADELGILGIKTSAGNYVETKKLVNSVYRHLTVKIEESTNMILMVFDGADDQSALLEFLPKSADYTPRILVTSQCTKWDSKFNCLELDMFNEENALKFFTDNTMKPQYTDAREIAELLNTISRHPLALQQAVSYIKENSVTVEEYTNLLDERHKDMMSKGTDQIGNPSVNKTLDTSINRLRKISLDVSDILDILAFLDGKEICKGFLIMFLNNDQVRLNSALTLLRKYAIVNYEINSKAEYNHQMIRIHSLAQLFLQSNQNVQEVSKNLEKITSAFIEDLRMCNKLYKPRDGKLWLNHFYKIYENNKWKKCLLNSFIYEQVLLEHFMESKGNYTKL
ncbi:MAG: NB-ARC domain-containing protein, partial [Cyanobacteria bacterium J06649_11]